MSSGVPVPFDVTNRDYLSIKDQLVSYVQSRFPGWNPSNSADFGLALLEAFAMIGDNLSYYLDRIANESTITSATQPDSVFALARQLGYEPGLPTPASATITFTNNGTSTATIPALTKLFGVSSVNGYNEDIVFETQTALSLPAASSGTLICLQGTTQNGDGTGVVLGTSDGTANQSFTIPDRPVASGSVRVIVNDGTGDVEWLDVPNLYDYGPGDFVFQTHSLSNTAAFIQFGNGTYGAVPSANSTIKSIYRIGGGLIGNVGAGVVQNFSGTPVANIAISQLIAAYGGAEAESLSSIRQNAPGAFYAQRRAVTASDYSTMAEQLPFVSKANADTSLWSNPVVYVAPPDDGSYTPGLVGGGLTVSAWNGLLSTQGTLQLAAMAGVTVSVAPPTYVPIALKVTCYLDPRTSQTKADAAVYDVLTQLFAFGNQDFGTTLSVHDVLFAISQIKSASLVVSGKSLYYQGNSTSGGGGGGLNRKVSGPQSNARGVSGTGHVSYADITDLYRKDSFSSGLHVPTTGKSYEIFYLNALQSARTTDTTNVLLTKVTYGDLVISLSGGIFDVT